MLRGELGQGRGLRGRIFHGGIYHVGENFHEGAAGFSSIIKKTMSKKNSAGSKEQY